MEEATRIPSNASSALKAGEFGFPVGHLGHLTTAQESALVDFKKLCVESRFYKPASSDNQRPSHSDAILLRYLRARRFVPKDALQQFTDTEKWRALNEIDTLYENIDIDNYDEARRLYPQSVGRRDKRGLPVYLFEVQPLDSKTMAAYAKSSSAIAVVSSSTSSTSTTLTVKESRKSTDSKNAPNAKAAPANDVKTQPRLLRLFALYENLVNFMSVLCTVNTDRPHPETPIVQANNIVDISGVGLKQFWNLRGHMQDASVLATAYYPETLDRIFIVGAPAFFPTVWSWIKRWFDPITVSKIFILSTADALPTLTKFIDIENIPKKYGGKLDFEFGDLAPVDPAYTDKIEWKYSLEELQKQQNAAKNVVKEGLKDEGKKEGKGKKKKEQAERPAVRRWPRGPLKWIERDDGDLDLFAVGSEGGKLRREIIATLRLGGNVGGSADPTGPLQRKLGNQETAVGEGRGEETEEGREKQVNGEPVAPAAPAVTQTGGVANVDNLAVETAALSVDPGEQQEEKKEQLNGTTNPEPSDLTAAMASAAPAAEPVPLDAVATALPGEGYGKGEK